MIVNYEHAFTQWASVKFGGGAAAAGAGKKPVSFSPLSTYRNDQFTKTGPGQNIGKARQKDLSYMKCVVHEIDGVSGEPVAVKDDAPDIPGLQLLFAPGAGRLFVFS